MPVIDAAAAAFPAWRDTSLAKRTSGAVQRSANCSTLARGRWPQIITRRARQGPLRCPRRGQPWPARSSSSLAASRICSRVDSPRTPPPSVDVHSMLPAAGTRRHHLAVQLPGHGAHVVLPDRDRRGQHRGAQALGEGSVGSAVDGPAVGRGRPAPRACSTCCRVTRPRVDELLTNPKVKAHLLRRAPLPSRSTCYATATAAGKRVPGPRRGQEPRGDPARRRSGPGRRRDGQRRFRFRR